MSKMGILRNLAESFAMKREFVKMGIFREIRYNIKTKWDPTLSRRYYAFYSFLNFKIPSQKHCEVKCLKCKIQIPWTINNMEKNKSVPFLWFPTVRNGVAKFVSNVVSISDLFFTYRPPNSTDWSDSFFYVKDVCVV